MKKRYRHVALVLFAVLVFTGLLITTSPKSTKAADGLAGLSPSHIQRGFQISPVALNLKLKGLNRSLVGEGSYIVNAMGGCNDCHTCPPYAPGGNPFIGEETQINATNYLAGGTMFGPFRADDITPDANGLPSGMTLEEFKVSMRTGHDFHEDDPLSYNIQQVMPWPAYRNMTDRDLEAIYEYLRTIPHAEPGICGTPG